jgi:helix-turn-helix protein
MSPAWLLDSGVSANAKVLYAMLGLYADRETGRAWPSRTTLARRMSCGVKTVDRALAELVELGAVDVTRRKTSGRNETNVYILRQTEPVQGGSVTSDATSVRDDATSGATADASDGVNADAQNQNHVEPQPVEPVNPHALARVAVYDPLKGKRIDGQDLPWNALEEATNALGPANGARMRKALSSIRVEAWGVLLDRTGWEHEAAMAAMQEETTWHGYEEALAAEITRRADALKADAPHLTYGPEGIARNWTKGGLLLHDRADVLRAMNDLLERARGADAA